MTPLLFIFFCITLIVVSCNAATPVTAIIFQEESKKLIIYEKQNVTAYILPDLIHIPPYLLKTRAGAVCSFEGNNDSERVVCDIDSAYSKVLVTFGCRSCEKICIDTTKEFGSKCVPQKDQPYITQCNRCSSSFSFPTNQKPPSTVPKYINDMVLLKKSVNDQSAQIATMRNSVYDTDLKMKSIDTTHTIITDKINDVSETVSRMNNNIVVVTSSLAQTISDFATVKSSVTDTNNSLKTINSTMTALDNSVAVSLLDTNKRITNITSTLTKTNIDVTVLRNTVDSMTTTQSYLINSLNALKLSVDQQMKDLNTALREYVDRQIIILKNDNKQLK